MNKIIGLINYEGDALKLLKINSNEFVIYDQWDSIVEVLTFEELCDWFDGSFPLFDSQGKSWIYTEHSRESKQRTFNLINYIRS
jgi:hypothetical protein